MRKKMTAAGLLLSLVLVLCASCAETGAGAEASAPVQSVASVSAGTGAHGGTDGLSEGTHGGTARSSRDADRGNISSRLRTSSGRSHSASTQNASSGTAVSDTSPAPQGQNTQTQSTQTSAAQTPEAQQDQAAQPPAQETAAPAAPETPPPVQGNGRMLFVGDSRTIDMFADSDEPIYGRVDGDIVIYAMHARGCDYLIATVDAYGHDNFDTLVTWMGANDRGNFASYEAYYNSLLAEGKKIIVCTVGPTADGWLVEADVPNYTNDKMVAFNASLVAWAYAHGVQVIDLYTYIAGNIQIDSVDGIHYLPRPTTAIWQVIRGSL